MKKIIFSSMLSLFLYTTNINSSEIKDVDNMAEHAVHNSSFPVIESKHKTSKYMVPINKKDSYATDTHFSARARLFSLLDTERVQALDKPSLISSCEGSIDSILLTIPWWVLEGRSDPETGKYFNAYSSMVTQMPDVKKFYIMMNERSQAISDSILSEWGIKDRSELVFVPDRMKFTVWAEDAYCVCKDLEDNDTYLVEPASFNRAHDYLIADKLASIQSFFSKNVSLYFQGGNILIGDSFWMIGAAYPTNSLKLNFITIKPGETEKQAVARGYGSLLDNDRKLFVIGSTVPVPQEKTIKVRRDGEIWSETFFTGNHDSVQPLFHIDMFISFVGRDKSTEKFNILVGDPRMAADILEMERPWRNSMIDVFDNIAEQLRELGFNVRRNPLPLAYDDNVETRERIWYFATSNNVIMQNKPKVVWIPTYGHGAWSDFHKTDEVNKAIWQEFGFEVRQLSDFHTFAANLGAAHCIKKYIARS